MPFEQTEVPEVHAGDVMQIRCDIAALWGCDGRYLDQLTRPQVGAFFRLRARGLALLDHQSKLDEQLDAGKVRVNDEVKVGVIHAQTLRSVTVEPVTAAPF